ncbi:DUF982 domain-containing protein [Neorhizobium sp. BETTINA12A]|uniref:DUF982 domain-containing protein n=1 Tax=Neorhizobium TaxID=1525371 RepID=UPI0009B7E941|nr:MULTISPECIES: DUF982 domain-containing protein [Neorhizobium]MCJ9750752.1 DUF982 domain-containing protein [Neorhizobium sp. BETTINA12A]
MEIPDSPFSCPVTTRLQSGLEHTFQNAYDALDFLENEWPSRRGELWHRAVRKCRAAVESSAPSDIAQEAFVSACLEAGMPFVWTDDIEFSQAPAGRRAAPSH